MQTAQHILLVRPAHFGFNPTTAKTNSFQHSDLNSQQSQKMALEEFDRLTAQLDAAQIYYLSIDDTADPIKPDAIFPNNWLVSLPSGELSLHPMHSQNRRLERRKDILQRIEDEFELGSVHDLSHHEENNRALEGTGSIVFDHERKVAYACRSLRTNPELLEEYCQLIGYSAFIFSANDRGGDPIYHTNVMMSIGENVIVICLDSVDKEEKDQLIDHLRLSKKDILEISFDQMEAFCANLLEARNRNDESYFILSQTAYEAFQKEQLHLLKKNSKLLIAEINIIQRIGGGGVRCMIAEIFLPLKKK